MRKLPEWKKKICARCIYYPVCDINKDCQALKIIEWEHEDLVDDNTEIGDW